MQRALSLFILLALLAPSFPMPLLAEDVGTTTSPDNTSTSTPPAEIPTTPPSDESFVPTISGTIISESPASAWNPSNWTGSQSLNYPYGSLGLTESPYFLQEGRITAITMPLGFKLDPSQRVTFQLTADSSHSPYECSSVTKTAAEWGLGTGATTYNLVTIPFDGPHCDTRIQRKDLGTHITAGVEGVYGSFVTFPTTAEGNAPLIAYAADLPGATRITADIMSDLTLHTGHTYVIAGRVNVASGATVTVEPGTILKFDSVTSGFTVYGSFIAHGTTTDPIYFTSFRDDTIAGDTNGDGTASIPEAGNWEGIISNGGTISLEGSIIRYGSYRMLVGDKTQLSVHNSSITNAVLGIKNYNPDYATYTSAENNWWGDASGPLDNDRYRDGLGQVISPYISAYPWLSVDPFVSATTTTCTTNCNSSVLFLPGIKGSVLRSGANKLWPPTVWTNDVSSLALTAGGESVNPIQVDGILNFFYGTPVYDGFSTFMNNLVTDGTIKEWLPMPYDWRFSPEKILADGIQTPTGTVDMVHAAEELAARSRTGKITIVAHSMGGLMGKALIKALEDKGEANLVDSFVMVGSPQLGTPQGVVSLLHGDDEGIAGGIIVNAPDVRQVGKNMSSAYNLLPSPRYFTEVADPVITFDSNASFTSAWRNRWGSTTDTFSEFNEFITGLGVTRTDPVPSNLIIPEILRTDVENSTIAFHNTFDSYVIPASIYTVQVAGWGVPTLKGIMYQSEHSQQNYEPIFTREGDKTVVYPSAISSAADETYYFNLFDYNETLDKNAEHKDLLSAQPVQTLLVSVIHHQNTTLPNFISTTKPVTADVADQLLISTHSPVLLGAYDSHGNFTGIKPNQNSSGLLTCEESIPGSTCVSIGGDQYVFLPKEGTYTLQFKGTGTGPATIQTDTFSNDIRIPVTAYTDIPVTVNTEGTFVVDSSAPQDATVQVDQNGDGTIDTYVASDTGTLSLSQLLTNLKGAVQSLSTTKPQQKIQLLNKVTNIESKIDKQKQKQSNVLAKLQAQIAKKVGKGKIDTTTANSVSSLLDDLISQSTLVPLDNTLIRQLKDQINAAAITSQLKTNLLAKVARLESILGINRSLDTMSKAVIKKGTKGVLTDAEMQNLLNLLDQIQSAI